VVDRFDDRRLAQGVARADLGQRQRGLTQSADGSVLRVGRREHRLTSRRTSLFFGAPLTRSAQLPPGERRDEQHAEYEQYPAQLGHHGSPLWLPSRVTPRPSAPPRRRPPPP